MTIVILSVSVPTGKKPYNRIQISYVTDVPGVAGSITLLQNGVAICAQGVIFNGTNGTATFPKGTVASGTYDVVAMVFDGTDSDTNTTKTLVVEALDEGMDVLQEAFIEAIEETLRVSALIDIKDDRIFIDRVDTKQRGRKSILIQRQPMQIGFATLQRKEWIFNANVFVITNHALQGERRKKDRAAHITLMSNVIMALEANEYLGGIVHLPLDLSDVELFSDAVSDDVIWEQLRVTGRYLNFC